MSTNTMLQRLQLLLHLLIHIYSSAFCMLHVDQGHCTPLVPGQQHARQVAHVQHSAAGSLVQAIDVLWAYYHSTN
jgi:hypothetical protein